MLDSGVLTEGPASFGRSHGRRWLVTDYEAGDVVLHSTFMIHASTINHDPDNVIRLATDLRFVNSSKPWDKVCWAPSALDLPQNGGKMENGMLINMIEMVTSV